MMIMGREAVDPTAAIETTQTKLHGPNRLNLEHPVIIL